MSKLVDQVSQFAHFFLSYKLCCILLTGNTKGFALVQSYTPLTMFRFFLAFKACFPGSNLGRLCNESVAITSTAVLSGVELALLASILNLLIFILI